LANKKINKEFTINLLFPNVATKEDVKEIRGEMTQLRREIAQLRDEMHSNFKWTIGVVLTIWGATVIPILLRLIGAI
jgi:phosphoenolpyruvate-protein kinase (PTS system EI component)